MGNEILFKWSWLMTKMAATSIYGKNHYEIFSITRRPITLILVAGSSLTDVTGGDCVVVLQVRHIYPSLVLVQPRKTHPCLTVRLSTGRKESNHTNKSLRQVCSIGDVSPAKFVQMVILN